MIVRRTTAGLAPERTLNEVITPLPGTIGARGQGAEEDAYAPVRARGLIGPRR